MSLVTCKNGHTAKVAKELILGQKLFYCPVCLAVHIEGSRWWIEMGAGWEDQVIDQAERVASEAKRLKEFMDSEIDSPWFDGV
jgi:hypothetical protein